MARAGNRSRCGRSPSARVADEPRRSPPERVALLLVGARGRASSSGRDEVEVAGLRHSRPHVGRDGLILGTDPDIEPAGQARQGQPGSPEFPEWTRQNFRNPHLMSPMAGAFRYSRSVACASWQRPADRGLRITAAARGSRIADCGLRTADCGLRERSADRGLRIADCGSRRGLRIADCGSRQQPADRGLRIAAAACGSRTRIAAAACGSRTADRGSGLRIADCGLRQRPADRGLRITERALWRDRHAVCLRTANRKSRIADSACGSWTADRGSRTADCESRIADRGSCGLRIADCGSR